MRMPVRVHYLEMTAVTELRPKRCGDPAFWVGEARTPQWQFNRAMYLWVGAAWNWHEKVPWTEPEWRAYAEDPNLRTFGAYVDGAPAGYYELKRDGQGGIQIAYFGLTPAFYGRGLGGALLTHALKEAWAEAPPRVWVHTCSMDHPAALANYQARGMRVYRVEDV